MRILSAVQSLMVVLPLLLVSTAWGAEPFTHCTENEAVVFSCQIANSSKVLSVCSSQELGPTSGYLQYRYGRPGKVELEHPDSTAKSQQEFKYSRYTRPKVTYMELSFARGDFLYTVYDHSNEESGTSQQSWGVQVVVPLGELVDIDCAAPVESHLIDLEGVIPRKPQ